VRSPRALLLLVGLGVACAPRIAPFSELAYEQATALKVDALALTSHANEPFARHREAVADLTLRVEKAYEFARGRPRNEISTQQWEILRDPERNLLGGLLRRWESASTLSPVFIEEARRLIADAFDTIIGLESGKIKPEAVP
jgi:hypothetical protein